MSDSTGTAPVKHLGYLDAARGIAALMVMAYHFINWKYDSHTGAKVASVIFNGSDAVSFFFVLSGFVLSYQYIVLNQPLDIGKFYVNRFFRLWPAFFLTIVINALNVNRHDLHLHNLADIFLRNKTHFWEEAILIRNRIQYYGAGWTLAIELALSFMIPFWVVLAKKDRRLIVWLLIAYLLILNNMRDLFMFHFHFALGVLLSCLFSAISAPSFRQTKWYRYRYPIIAAAFVLYSARHIDRLWSFGATYNYWAKYFGIDIFIYTAIASFVFIAAIIQSANARKILQHRLLLFMGKISYGIYLMHWLLVNDVFDNWDKIRSLFPGTRSAFMVTFLVYAALTILLSAILHYAVELPFIRLGKKLTGRMKPSVVIN